MPKTLRGGMIGAGAWSETQLTAWSKVVNAKIVALCDRHPDRRESLVARFEIPNAFDDAAAMLREGDLDFVDICTRPVSHASLIRLAAEHHVPVLCQKPFCTSLEEARAMVALCRAAGVRLMINENFRWQAWYRTAKELLDSAALGEPFLAIIQRRLRITLPQFKHPQAYLREMPNLILYEVGVHYLDTLRFLFGDPDSVFARLHKVSNDVAGEDVQVLSLNYPWMTAIVVNSWASVQVPGLDRPAVCGASSAAPRMEIDGSKATLVLGHDGSMQLASDSGDETWKPPGDAVTGSHVAAQQHFIDCLGSGAEFETSGEDTLRTMSLVYACYRSAKEGEVVTVGS